MLPYWLLFLVPALLAISSPPSRKMRRDGTRFARSDPIWVLMLLLLTIMIGFRFRVGGDWGAYFEYLIVAATSDLRESLLLDDPGFRVLNLFSIWLGFGIIGVNTVSGLIFSAGLLAFCRSLPRPWLALAVAVPYLVIVVGMGYTRQAVAIGLVMLGLVALGRQKWVWFILWVLLAATFHKTAVILLPIVALTMSRNRWLIILLVGVTGGVGYQVLLGDSADTLVRNYIDAELQSGGALIRLGMNALPALLFLFYRKKIMIAPSEYRIWRLFAFISVGLFVAMFGTSASTALDRLGLYMLPLQLFLFAHLPDLMGRQGKQNSGIVTMILAYYAAILFVWFNFGSFSFAWVPYRMHLGG
ncbi:EpsG family protein [Roseibaca sp. V10]|uniref:EpsG family protein n=1 Tax=Roseinatronobacter domitianus TaxID=2940293 RepID=A0ABT0M2X4_9RHOB|nr:EpsG family protein [Roseibaca domitiana]MCL1629206.1 EpsG family protein [Roseibaca domitiana]